MNNVINLKPVIDSEKLLRELEAIDRIEKLAQQMEQYDMTQRSKMIAHTAGYLKRLIIQSE